MKISEIYKRYTIPKNLQEHMIRVAAVGVYLVKHWQKPEEVNRDLIIKTLLLHDMGNIIKFNFDGNQFIKKDEIDYWKKIQTDFIKKYGTDEHEATLTIAKDIGVSENILDLLTVKGESSTHDAVESADWNKKIKGYADLRVGPYGIVSVSGRFDDVLIRYKGSQHKLGDIEKVAVRRKWAHELENQIQSRVNFNLQSISDETITGYFKELENYSIS